jgi:Flp pilus assembly protein TadG
MDRVLPLHRRKRRGAAVVEFAIVAPLFFLLIFGMIEYGRMVMVQQVITNASREGARRAVLDGATATDVKTTVTNYLSSAGITGSADYVTLDPADPNSAGHRQPVTVEVSVPFADVSWIGGPLNFIGTEDISLGGTDLKASTVMSRESVQ